MRARVGDGLVKLNFLSHAKNPRLFLNDPSFRYRCANVAEILTRKGVQSLCLHVGETPCSVGGALIFHRPDNGLVFQRIFRRQKFLITRMVAECDDLVFDPDMAEFSPGVVNGIVGLEQTRKMFANNRAALQKFSRISTSTEPLAEEMQRVFPKAKVCVIPNAVYHEWLDLPEPPHPRPKILTYLPGTRSHDRDFEIVAPVLEDLLFRHSEIRLHVTGPLSFGVRAREGQVVAKEKVEFSIYHECVAEGRVNLAPLEESPFNRCKSALKILEAGFFGIPTVCSDFPDARRFLGAGAHIAYSPEDWRAALETLLFDEETYRAETEGLRERVLELAHPEQMAQKWLEFLKN
jgi:glycosyltransferase involved in cell wall biosynthesis